MRSWKLRILSAAIFRASSVSAEQAACAASISALPTARSSAVIAMRSKRLV